MASTLAEKEGKGKRRSIDMENLTGPVNSRTQKDGNTVGGRVMKKVSFTMEGDGVKVVPRNCDYGGSAVIGSDKFKGGQ